MQEQNNPNDPDKKSVDQQDANAAGYPIYPADEDIYNQADQVDDLDPERLSNVQSGGEMRTIVDNDKVGELQDNDFGSDLDVPGSELDDAQEDIGNEDEENNYYSLGDN